MPRKTPHGRDARNGDETAAATFAHRLQEGVEGGGQAEAVDGEDLAHDLEVGALGGVHADADAGVGHDHLGQALAGDAVPARGDDLVGVRHVGATDIRGIEEETRQAVRDIVALARRSGWHPHQFAPLVRDTVGLTSRQAKAVVNLYTGQAGEIGEQRAAKLADAYARRLQTQRAKTIARTETLKAANLGRIASFEQAANNGLFDRDRAQLEWIATMDSRTCSVCAGLNGDRVPVGSTFDGQLPPRHPQCRCTVRLVLD